MQKTAVLLCLLGLTGCGATVSYVLPHPPATARDTFPFIAAASDQIGHRHVQHADSINVRYDDTTWIQFIGRSFYPFLATGARSQTARPPFKPCMRISRTRLTGGLSGLSIVQPPGTGPFHAGDAVPASRNTRASTA